MAVLYSALTIAPRVGDDFIGHIGDIGIVPQGFTIQANIIAAIGVRYGTTA